MVFKHIFTYRLKCLLRDHENIFWTLFFPLIMATLFNMAFSNLGSAETFKPVDIAVVNDEQYRQDKNFKSAVEKLSSGDDRLFNLSVVSREEADDMLKNNIIDGYIIAGWPIKLVVNQSGLNQNIIKSFTDNYMQTVSALNTILSKDPGKLQNLINEVESIVNYVKEVSHSNAEPDNILLYFYSLIAMACFYGGFFGMREVSDVQADISPVAARVNTAPVHKLKTFIYSSAASIIIHLAEMLLLLAYLIFALKIDFGSKTAYVLLTTFIGSIAGFFFGAFVSAAVKKSEGVKVGVLVSATMICCFLAGMMYQDIKYIIERNMPALSYLNPVNLLTDAFYSLYYYDTFTRFFTDIAILTAFVAVFGSGTCLIIRRRKYASL